MKISDRLLEAARIVERGWCRGALARDDDGNYVSYLSPAARQYCAAGAILLALRGAAGEIVMHHYVRQVTDSYSVERWNDRPSRTQAEVVAAFRRAAALAQEYGE